MKNCTEKRNQAGKTGKFTGTSDIISQVASSKTPTYAHEGNLADYVTHSLLHRLSILTPMVIAHVGVWLHNAHNKAVMESNNLARPSTSLEIIWLRMMDDITTNLRRQRRFCWAAGSGAGSMQRASIGRKLPRSLPRCSRTHRTVNRLSTEVVRVPRMYVSRS